MRAFAIALALGVTACATQHKTVEPDEFVPHGSFAPTMGRDQAFMECKLVAENAGRQMLSSGQPGALPTLYGPPPLVVRTVLSTMDTCMQSKGYRWTSPR